MEVLKYYLTVALMILLISCKNTLDIGIKVEKGDHGIDELMILVSGASAEKGFATTKNGIEFLVVTNDENRITYIATRSPDFETQDGAKIGDILSRFVSLDNLQTEYGWGCYAELPSKWNAAYYCDYDNTGSGTIEWFFKRE